MLLTLHSDFAFYNKGKRCAYVEDGILKIDSRFVYWEDLMYELTYKLYGRNSCLYCGIKCRKDKITIDHVFPRNYGGISISNNLLPACNECNSLKNNLNKDEFLELKKRKTHKEMNDFRNEIIRKKEQMRYSGIFDLPEGWVSYCNIKSLKIRDFYRLYYTESKRLQQNKSYIEKFNHLQRPIIVDKNFWILDGYTWYLAAKYYNFTKVPIIILENVEIVKK